MIFIGGVLLQRDRGFFLTMGMGVLACQKGPWYILLLVKRGTEGSYLTKERGVIAYQKETGFILLLVKGGQVVFT